MGNHCKRKEILRNKRKSKVKITGVSFERSTFLQTCENEIVFRSAWFLQEFGELSPAQEVFLEWFRDSYRPIGKHRGVSTQQRSRLCVRRTTIIFSNHVITVTCINSTLQTRGWATRDVRSIPYRFLSTATPSWADSDRWLIAHRGTLLALSFILAVIARIRLETAVLDFSRLWHSSVYDLSRREHRLIWKSAEKLAIHVTQIRNYIVVLWRSKKFAVRRRRINNISSKYK